MKLKILQYYCVGFNNLFRFRNGHRFQLNDDEKAFSKSCKIRKIEFDNGCMMILVDS